MLCSDINMKLWQWNLKVGNLICDTANIWIDLPGLRHGKLFIYRPCKKRADDLLKLGKHRLKMAPAIYTGHAPVRGHLFTVGLFDGDPIRKFCGMETETVRHIICCCEALARQRYNVFVRPTVEPKDISTASIGDLCLFTRGAGLLRLCRMAYWGCTIDLRLRCNRCIRWWAVRIRRRCDIPNRNLLPIPHAGVQHSQHDYAAGWITKRSWNSLQSQNILLYPKASRLALKHSHILSG